MQILQNFEYPKFLEFLEFQKPPRAALDYLTIKQYMTQQINNIYPSVTLPKIPSKYSICVRYGVSWNHSCFAGMLLGEYPLGVFLLAFTKPIHIKSSAI